MHARKAKNLPPSNAFSRPRNPSPSYGQNSHKPKSVLVVEVLWVFSCCKPGVDALRVVRGGEKDPLLTMDPMQEMAISKAGEMTLEALPGGVLQTIIMMGAKTRTNAAFISIVLSAASSGYTATTLSFDYDTSVTKRKQSPKM